MAFNSLPTYTVGDIITDTYLNQVRDNFDYLKGKAGTTVAIENNLRVGPVTAGASSSITIGGNSSGNRYAYFDLSGDDTYGDGLRFIRDNTGPDTTSRVVHRGTGNFEFQTIEAANIWFRTNASYRGGVSAAGRWGFGTTSPQQRVHVLNENGVNAVYVGQNIGTGAVTLATGATNGAGFLGYGKIGASGGFVPCNNSGANGTAFFLHSAGSAPVYQLSMAISSGTVTVQANTTAGSYFLFGWLLFY